MAGASPWPFFIDRVRLQADFVGIGQGAGMDAQFWMERWEKGDIGFHQAGGNDLLVRHWPALELAGSGAVFVPLCGKSLDMMWLAGRGHQVVGSELSQLAVADFFREQRIEAELRQQPGFEVHAAGAITIWRGDFFALPAAATRGAVAVYDRAALVAMPPDMQTDYAATLRALAGDAPILLVALDYPAGEISGPPFATPEAQVRVLFGDTHDIAVLEVRDGLANSPALKTRGVSRLEEAVYVLRRRGD
jgi:thiopurine S-methyltransferase